MDLKHDFSLKQNSVKQILLNGKLIQLRTLEAKSYYCVMKTQVIKKFIYYIKKCSHQKKKKIGKRKKTEIGNESLRYKLNIIPLNTQIEQPQLRQLGHPERMPQKRIPKTAYEYIPDKSRRELINQKEKEKWVTRNSLKVCTRKVGQIEMMVSSETVLNGDAGAAYLGIM